MNPKRHPPTPILDTLPVMARSKGLEARSVAIAGTDQDYAAARQFLLGYDGSMATFNAYRRELERLLQWSWHIRRRSVLVLVREDIESFIRFTLKPPLAWIGSKNVARFVHRDGERVANPSWRPFVVSIPKSEFRSSRKADPKKFVASQPAVRATFTALSSFYDYLNEESLAVANPIRLIRQKSKYIRKQHNRAPVRRISNLQWDYVMETAELLAEDDPTTHERTLFIMTCLFAMYLRVSELVADERSVPAMGNFRKDTDGNWWFHVTGKGNKDRTVTVSDAMLKALKRYRRFRGFSALPSIQESTPLVTKNLGQGPISSTRHLRRIVQHCFDQSYARMREDGLEEDAIELREATVHWLRHTGISEDVKERPKEHVRDDAGHASMATTDRYIESDRRERHESGKKKRVKDF